MKGQFLMIRTSYDDGQLVPKLKGLNGLYLGIAVLICRYRK